MEVQGAENMDTSWSVDKSVEVNEEGEIENMDTSWSADTSVEDIMSKNRPKLIQKLFN